MNNPVTFVHPAAAAVLPIWERIRAATGGQASVKKLTTKVLPMPNATDTSPENIARYNAYMQRAVWYGASSRTLDGWCGYVFQKEPKVVAPPSLKPLLDNVDGAGVTLNQQAKEALRLTLSLGRCGLLVDYPKVEGQTTKAQLESGLVSPTILLYEPEDITNWRTMAKGARQMLTLLVLRERRLVQSKDNEFELTEATQYRVLTLDPAIGVLGRVFTANDKNEFTEDASQAYAPKDSTGNAFTEIPFCFIGAENNDTAVDAPPLRDLVDLNLAHFVNSADHEESTFFVGQPTPYVAGLTQAWVDNVLKGTILLGSRAVIPLPAGGTAGLLQAAPNTMPFEAMKHKEVQMVALGAKLVESTTVQRTATEATLDHAGEVSVLGTCATNTFLAIIKALKFAGQFTGATEMKIEYTLSEALSLIPLTQEVATAITGLLQAQLIDFEEARRQLKKSGVAWKDDQEVRDNNAADGFDQPTTPPADSKSKPEPKAK